MKPFRYALEPALEAARSRERAAARAFVAAEHAASAARARVIELAATANAIVASAAVRDRPNERHGTASVDAYLDRERALVSLAVRAARARERAEHAASDRVTARDAYDVHVRRRRSFEAHRERARAADATARELAEAAEFDEANAAIHEAGSEPTGKTAT